VNSLEQIQAAASQLPKTEQEKLFDFLLSQLEPKAGTLPPPREFTEEQIQKWLSEDEGAWAKIKSQR
jgi:hypothetical protein